MVKQSKQNRKFTGHDMMCGRWRGNSIRKWWGRPARDLRRIGGRTRRDKNRREDWGDA